MSIEDGQLIKGEARLIQAAEDESTNNDYVLPPLLKREVPIGKNTITEC